MAKTASTTSGATTFRYSASIAAASGQFAASVGAEAASAAWVWSISAATDGPMMSRISAG